MNKKELIEKINAIPWDEGLVVDTLKINRAGLIQLIEQFDEPKEKVALPRPVANWISCVRGRNKTLHFALENAPEEVNLWFCEDEKIGKIFLLTLGSMAIISRERSGIL